LNLWWRARARHVHVECVARLGTSFRDAFTDLNLAYEETAGDPAQETMLFAGERFVEALKVCCGSARAVGRERRASGFQDWLLRPPASPQALAAASADADAAALAAATALRDEARRREARFAGDAAEGPAAPPTRAAPPVPREAFAVTFDAGTLGLSIDEDPADSRGPPPVIRVAAGGPAEAAGVRVGDVLVRVGPRAGLSYAGVLEELPKLPRPLALGFHRGAAAAPAGLRDGDVVLEQATAEAPAGLRDGDVVLEQATAEARRPDVRRATATVRAAPLEAAVARSAAKRRGAPPPPDSSSDDTSAEPPAAPPHRAVAELDDPPPDDDDESLARDVAAYGRFRDADGGDARVASAAAAAAAAGSARDAADAERSARAAEACAADAAASLDALRRERLEARTQLAVATRRAETVERRAAAVVRALDAPPPPPPRPGAAGPAPAAPAPLSEDAAAILRGLPGRQALLPSIVDDAALAFPPPDFEPSFDYLGAFADAAPASSLAASSARSPLAIDRSRGRSGW